jgi:hypothetical protein
MHVFRNFCAMCFAQVVPFMKVTSMIDVSRYAFYARQMRRCVVQVPALLTKPKRAVSAFRPSGELVYKCFIPCQGQFGSAGVTPEAYRDADAAADNWPEDAEHRVLRFHAERGNEGPKGGRSLALVRFAGGPAERVGHGWSRRVGVAVKWDRDAIRWRRLCGLRG